jgi:hypothetical protein
MLGSILAVKHARGMMILHSWLDSWFMPVHQKSLANPKSSEIFSWAAGCTSVVKCCIDFGFIAKQLDYVLYYIILY